MPLRVVIPAPAPVRHVPARSRNARTSYVPVDVEVEIRELWSGDAPRGPDLPVTGDRTVVTHVVDGALWRPVGCDDPFKEGPKAPRDARDSLIGRTSFLTWLEGGDGAVEMDMTDVGRCFEGTPILPRVPGQRAPQRPDGNWNPARQGTLLLDERHDTPRRVTDYVEANVALIDGIPYMRMPGPLAYLWNRHASWNTVKHPSWKACLHLVRHPGAWTTNSAMSNATLVRYDRAAEMMRALGTPDDGFDLAYDPATLSGYAHREDDDVETMLRDCVRGVVAVMPRDGYALQAGRGEELMRLSALASVGAIDPSQVAGAWESIRDIASELLPGAPRGGGVAEQCLRTTSYADLVALPRLRDREAVAGEDLASLEGLGM